MAPPDQRHDRPAPRERAIPRPWNAPADRARRSAPGPAPRDESFLAHFLSAPSIVGGIAPSSPALGRALSRHAAGFDAIVELGAGAGSITRHLAADHPGTRLTVIERSATMARRLQRVWPRADVRAGCVHEHADCLDGQPWRCVAVSSIPFRSLPDDLARPTIALIERFLLAHPGRRLVQYSYGLRAPFDFGARTLEWRRVERVWRNLPPAIVWIADGGQGVSPSRPRTRSSA
jgi:phospholipid N-methyltransferase